MFNSILTYASFESWTSLGIICQDGAIDIAPLNWILYVRIKDVSNPLEFSGVVDGFHLDGIQCIQPVQKQASDQQTVFTIYPIPVNNEMNIHFEALKQDQPLLVEIFTQTGKAVFTREMKTEGQSGHLTVPVNELSEGIYSVRITGADTIYTEQFIKK